MLRRADVVKMTESNTIYFNWDEINSAPGSKSMACNKSEQVNVGYPTDPSWKEYRPTSVKCEEVEKVNRKSEKA